jgi:hypothetical protein
MKDVNLTKKEEDLKRTGLKHLNETTLYSFLQKHNRAVVAFLQDASLFEPHHLLRLVADLELEPVGVIVGLVDLKANPEMARIHSVYHTPDIRLYNYSHEVLFNGAEYPMTFAQAPRWLNFIFNPKPPRFVYEARKETHWHTFKDLQMKKERVHFACICHKFSPLWMEAQQYKYTAHVPYEVFFMDPVDLGFQRLYGFEGEKTEKLLMYSSIKSTQKVFKFFELFELLLEFSSFTYLKWDIYLPTMNSF